ncbi:MAG: HAMP domain-containing sensor histidine kinase, partial [Thermonemataceae bacterium]|nr:HAMP domain-containing sensor histidine kinase [Thermonemataceae bacterium]
IIKLDNFIKDIIEYSRNARTELSYESLHIESFIEDIYKNLDYLDNAHKIDRQVEIQEEVCFITDTKRLSVIFNNLISNAINYHNFQQEHPWIKIHFLVQAKEALISISDNGLGIAEEHIHKIFNMFYRASYDSKGSGLGLYIVKEAVSKLGGTIAVASQKNNGTIFTIKIPNHTFEGIQDQDHHNNLKENVYLES